MEFPALVRGARRLAKSKRTSEIGAVNSKLAVVSEQRGRPVVPLTFIFEGC